MTNERDRSLCRQAVEWDAEEADRKAMEEEQDRANEEYAADMAAMEQAEERAQLAKEELINDAVEYMINLDRSLHPGQEEHLEETTAAAAAAPSRTLGPELAELAIGAAVANPGLGWIQPK